MKREISLPDWNILEAAFDHINHGVVIYDRDLVVVQMNRRAREILHVSPEDFSVGEPFEKLARINAENGGYGGAGSVEARVAARMEKARTFAPFEEDQRIFDGTLVEVFGRPIPGGGYAITYTDITRRANAEAELLEARDELERRMEARTVALRESEAQLRLVTDNVPAMIAYIDRDLAIRFANRPYAEFVGLPQDEIIGKHLEDVVDAARLRLNAPFMQRTLAGEVTSNQREWSNPDGEERHLRTTRVPHFGAGSEVRGYFIIHVDLTEHFEREEQLRQAQKMEAVGQLTGGVAHDFNNLLMVIQGNLELINDSLEDPVTIRMAQSAISAAERGADLTQRLLAYARRQPLRATSVDLVRLVEGMRDMLARTLGETIDVSISSSHEQWPAFADESLVETTILNLAINARDAMPHGGSLIIECANENIDVSRADLDAGPDRGGDFASLTVRDTGTGMSREVMDRAFEPFFTTKDVGQGSGLGLSMVYGFAKQSGGFVTMDSEAGRGTTVKLYLPRGHDVPVDEALGTRARRPSGTDKKILVIEDDQEVRELAVRVLENLGYTVVGVADGHAARRTLAAQAAPDLVLSDVVLPGGISGPEIVAEIKSSRADVRVVLMSGYSADVVDQKTLRDLDAVLLNKPFAMDQLDAAVRKSFE
jgi:PAS domain S-box-containing protein